METHDLKLIRMKKTANALFADIKTKSFPADMIILFGSFSRDCIHERSDMDICVVSDEDLTVQQMREIENYFYSMAQGEYEIDFTYCNNDKLRHGNQVFERIRKEGRVIYERI